MFRLHWWFFLFFFKRLKGHYLKIFIWFEPLFRLEPWVSAVVFVLRSLKKASLGCYFCWSTSSGYWGKPVGHQIASPILSDCFSGRNRLMWLIKGCCSPIVRWRIYERHLCSKRVGKRWRYRNPHLIGQVWKVYEWLPTSLRYLCCERELQSESSLSDECLMMRRSRRGRRMSGCCCPTFTQRPLLPMPSPAGLHEARG